MRDTIEISFSRWKIVMLVIGAALFVWLGTRLFLDPEGYRYAAGVIKVLGLLCIVFFGVCGLFVGSKLFYGSVGLRIDERGITDHSNATSVGLIEWKYITGLAVIQVASTKILILKTSQAQKYIDRAKNALSRRAMKSNNKMYGSPISIISSSLNIKFDALQELIVNQLLDRSVLREEAIKLPKPEKALDKEAVAKRFKIYNYVLLVLLVINILFVTLTSDIYMIEGSAWLLFFAAGMWLLVDVELLQIKFNFVWSLVMAICFCGYGYVILLVHPEISKLTTVAAISLLSMLVVQWPLRKLYLFIFKREPDFVFSTGSFSEVIYSMVLLFGGWIVIPILIVDYLR